jgi:type VI secretion system FHA domain protein
MLEAFCAGARLDASSFSGEDPAEVMRRLGAVYQQMVLGLADLMNERTSVKTEYRLERTTVRAEGNNPFRWAPAQRVAVDLLRPRDDGFLSGPAAVKVSFEDLKKHLLCMLAGLRAALASTLDSLSPEAVEGQMGGRSFLTNRGGAAWHEYGRLYAEFRRRAGDDPDSPINREFRAGYGRRLQELDAMSTRS